MFNDFSAAGEATSTLLGDVTQTFAFDMVLRLFLPFAPSGYDADYDLHY